MTTSNEGVLLKFSPLWHTSCFSTLHRPAFIYIPPLHSYKRTFSEGFLLIKGSLPYFRNAELAFQIYIYFLQNLQ